MSFLTPVHPPKVLRYAIELPKSAWKSENELSRHIRAQRQLSGEDVALQARHVHLLYVNSLIKLQKVLREECDRLEAVLGDLEEKKTMYMDQESTVDGKLQVVAEKVSQRWDVEDAAVRWKRRFQKNRQKASLETC